MNELFERELRNTLINDVSLADYIKENYVSRSVLDKIRAEIADLPIRPEYQQTEHEKGFIDATSRALQILDKYAKGGYR